MVVAGGGGAGMAAAIAAREAGAEVVLLESEAKLGGSTALSYGHYYAAGTRLQREAGVTDGADALFADYMAISRYRVQAGLVRRFADRGADALEWLIGLGADYSPAGVRSSGPTPRSIARGHHYAGGRGDFAAVLERACRSRGVEIHASTRVTALEAEGGRVRGVTADGRTWEGGAVVVATGGFARNRELLERHYAAALAAGDWLGSDAGAGCRGDAIELGGAVGADLGGEDRGLMVPIPRVHYRRGTVDPIYVSMDGRRFIDESVHYAYLVEAINAGGGSVFAVFDEAARLEMTGEYDHASPFRVADLHLDFHGAAPGAEASARGARAATAADLGRAIDVDPTVLTATIEAFNADCVRGVDSQFDKDPAHLRPLLKPPFYAVEMRAAVVVFTAFGLRIDREARVLDRSGRAITGLYAAGEAGPGVFGDVYVASGVSIANCAIFGRIAGANAAREARGIGIGG